MSLMQLLRVWRMVPKPARASAVEVLRAIASGHTQQALFFAKRAAVEATYTSGAETLADRLLKR